MRLLYRGVVAAASLLVIAAATVIAQAPSQSPGAGTPLAQFPGGQGGLTPGPGGFGLLPGQEMRLALYCVDLFNDSPTDRDEYRAAADARAVMASRGEQKPLDEALATGLLSLRGHDPTIDPPRIDGREWIDLYLRNNTTSPVLVSYPAGYAFMPKGRPAPALAPGIVRMLETAYTHRLTGSDTLAYAVWASRGFTRADVEETQLRPMPDSEVETVQKLLDAGEIPQRFDREPDEYARLSQTKAAALGTEAEEFTGTAALAGGRSVSVTGKRGDKGMAVVTVLAARSSRPLHYAARVRTWSDTRAELELLHLKTGRAIQVYNGRLNVKLAAS